MMALKLSIQVFTKLKKKKQKDVLKIHVTWQFSTGVNKVPKIPIIAYHPFFCLNFYDNFEDNFRYKKCMFIQSVKKKVSHFLHVTQKICSFIIYITFFKPFIDIYQNHFIFLPIFASKFFSVN